MGKKEIVTNILRVYGCSTSKEIVVLARRDYGLELTLAQVAGVLRPMIAVGDAASSKSASGANKYWLTNTD